MRSISPAPVRRALRRFLAGAALVACLVPFLATAAPRAKTTKARASAQAPRAEAGPPPYKKPPMAPGDTMIARVGDRTITLAEFREEWDRLQPDERPNVPDPVLAYKLVLNDLVTRELMAVEAEKHPRKLTPQQLAQLDSLWHVQARNQLFYEDVEARVELDTSQVERYRSELAKILFLTAYVFPEREQAQAWYTRIVGGTPVSRLEAAAQAGGAGAPQFVDLGHKIREDFDEETARILFTLAPGRFSTPIHTTQGWALFQLTGTRQRPNSIARGPREGVLREMRRIKANSFKEVYRDSLAKAIHLTYHDAAMDTILNRFLVLPDRASGSAEGGGRFNMIQPMPRFVPSDHTLLLATSDMGKVTGADLYAYLLGLGDIARPEVRSRDQLRPWVDRVAFDQALLKRAIAQGYDRKPRVLRAVSRLREFFLVSALYEDSVSAHVRPTESDLRAYFDQDTTRWKVREGVSLWVLGAPTRAQADSLLAEARAGGNLKELAFRHTTLSDFAQNGGMTPLFPRDQSPVPGIEDSAFATPIGDYGGPIVTPQGWIIFKVIDHAPERAQQFAEVRADVERAYRNDREEERMQLFLQRLRRRHGVETREQVLSLLVSAPKS